MAAQNTIGFLAAAVGTGVAAKAVEQSTEFAGLAAVAVFAVCMGVSSFLKVAPPKPVVKAKKMSKKEKRARDAAAAAVKSEVTDAADEAEEAARLVKAAKKRVKEQARKQAKRAAAAEEKVAAEQAEKQAEEDKKGEKKLSKTAAKKKKAKDKAKGKKADATKAEEVEVVTGAPEEVMDDSWEEVKTKKAKKIVLEEEVDSSAPQHTESIYVERKHFRVIIGTGGANLKSITEATGTEIEIPKEGSATVETRISGSKEGCARAKAAIQQLMTKGFCQLTHAGTVDASVDVPENKRGVVIGPKGANLKLLKEKLNVTVNLPEKGSDDNAVQIVGDSKAVKEAVAAIRSLVEHGYSSITHENFIMSNVEVARDLLRNLIGPAGATIRGLQNTHKVNINVPAEKSGEMVVVSMIGEAENIALCRAEIVALMVPPEPTPIPAEWTQGASLQHLDQW